ncbi:MAG: hypothetical protein ACPGXK_00130 [Phycisphaerae bacterium]
MADRYKIDGGVDNLWSSTSNWSTVSGGSGGASAPGPSDFAYVDGNSGASPVLELGANTSVRNLQVENDAAASTIIDLAGFALTAGDVGLAAGTLNLNGGSVTTKTLETGTTGAKITGIGGETFEMTQKVGLSFDTRYLADDGDDIAFGTESNPWRTLSKAETFLVTGKRCLFKRGGVFPVADGFVFDPDGGFLGAYDTGDLPIFELPAGGELILGTPGSTWTWYESVIRFAAAVGGSLRRQGMTGGMNELTGGIQG